MDETLRQSKAEYRKTLAVKKEKPKDKESEKSGTITENDVQEFKFPSSPSMLCLYLSLPGKQKDIQFVKYLLERKSSKNFPDENGIVPLLYATMRNETEIAKTLVLSGI